MFGYGIEMYNGTNISFDRDTVSIYYSPRNISIYVANTIMSDENGELLFFSNGCRFYNKNNEILTNGDSINIGGNDFLYNQGCDEDGLGYASGHQTMLALPYGGKYYVLHEDEEIRESPLTIYVKHLYYSVLDIKEDERGVVVEKNINILPQDSFLLGGQLTGIKHENGKDWWIIQHDYENNQYYILRLDSTGIHLSHTQKIGLHNTDYGGTGGAAVFSPDGSRYAKFSPNDGLYLMDFDRSTGMLSDFRGIKMEKEGISGSVAFSPSGRYLYINDRLYLYQFDMEAPDLESGKAFIGEWDGFIGNELGQGTTFGRMQLGPDCRIYMTTGPALPYMHVIEYPDMKGTDCGLVQHAIKLPTYHGQSMPSYPNYRLDTGYPTCDSSKVLVLTSAVSTPPTEAAGIRTYPNPVSHLLMIDGIPPHADIQIYDSRGRQVHHSTDANVYMEIDLSDLPAGIYILVVTDTSSGSVAHRKIIKQ